MAHSSLRLRSSRNPFATIRHVNRDHFSLGAVVQWNVGDRVQTIRLEMTKGVSLELDYRVGRRGFQAHRVGSNRSPNTRPLPLRSIHDLPLVMTNDRNFTLIQPTLLPMER